LGGDGIELGCSVDRAHNSEGCVSESKSLKKTGHRFEKGNAYGAAGRPQGSRNSATIALQSLLDGEGEAITRKAISMALEGDATAMRLVIERLIPPTRERRVNLTLPPVTTAADVTGAIGAVLQSVASGELAPGEGQQLAALLEAQRKSIETVQLEERLAALEARRDTKGISGK
jgi:hypothetical protein